MIDKKILAKKTKQVKKNSKNTIKYLDIKLQFSRVYK